MRGKHFGDEMRDVKLMPLCIKLGF